MALRLDEAVADALPHHMLMLDLLRQHHRQFDVLHFHTEIMQFPLLTLPSTPAVTTPARSSRPARPAAILSKVPRPRPGVDLQVAARAPASRQVDADNPSRAAAVAAELQPASGKVTLPFWAGFSPEKRPDRAIEIAWRAAATR